MQHLDEVTLKGTDQNYLFDELYTRLASGPLRFRISMQVAADGDVVNDATVHWPEDRELLKFGTVELNAIAEHNAEEQQRIIFDPIPRVDGIEPSDDPLLEVRAAVYLISGRRRRQASTQQVRTSGAG